MKFIFLKNSFRLSSKSIKVVKIALSIFIFFNLIFPTSLISGYSEQKSFLAQAEGHSVKKKKSKRSLAKDKHSEKNETRDENPKEVKEAENIEGKEFDHKDFDTEDQHISVDAVLLLDSSGSMQRTDPSRLRDQGAKLFIRLLGKDDRVAILQFDRNVKPIVGLTNISAEQVTAVDQAIDKVSVEGHFTDLQLPIQAASELLIKEGRSTATKVVVMLSDGKMDPHPSRGDVKELTNALILKDLPQYKENSIKLYTVSLSNEADKNLLAKLAFLSNGLHWFAPDGQTLHQKFSDLFLALKKPQVTSISENSFELDSDIDEATFYISRIEQTAEVSLQDPLGTLINYASFPSGVRWYRGTLFDIVTIEKPLPGKWTVIGLENAEGFATLLTNLKLESHWPRSTLRLGDSALLVARLTESGKVIAGSSVREVLYYTYKVIDEANGEIITKGKLYDNGQNGDTKGNDLIYSAVIKVEQEGDFKLQVGVTGPTFSRQQQIPFHVFEGIISVSLKKEDLENKEQEQFEVVVDQELKDYKVGLFAKRKDDNKTYEITLTPVKELVGTYLGLTTGLKAGNYEVFAKVKGKIKAGNKEEEATSKSIDYVSLHQQEPTPIGVEGVDQSSNVGEILFGILLVVLSLSWTVFLGYWFIKSFNLTKEINEDNQVSQISESIIQKIEQLRNNSSEVKRDPTPEELKMFSILAKGKMTTQIEKEVEAKEEEILEPTEEEKPQEESTLEQQTPN